MKNLALAAFIASIFVSPLSHATEDSGPSRPSLGALQRIIASRSPETTVATPDHDRITAQRIDIVDENGVIRMTLSGRTPAPIIDGIQYRRAFNVAGLVLYDDKGSERGGFGTADVAGGMAVLALDHPAMDAIGWRVSPDGEVAFSINQAPPLLREPALGNRLVPGGQDVHAHPHAGGCRRNPCDRVERQGRQDTRAADGNRRRLRRHRVPQRTRGSHSHPGARGGCGAG